MSEVLETWPDHFGHQLTDEDRDLAANVAAQGSSADLHQLGAHRSREARYDDTGELRHWRLLEGYSSLIARAAAGLDVRLATPVTRIRWSEHAASLTTSAGEHRADRAIVTLPLGLLQRDAVEFDPPLPDDKRDAIARLNAGHISKVILKLDAVYWPPELTFLWTPLDTQLWWRPGQGQPNEEPLLTAFFGGADAARLEHASPADAIAEATRHLADILGRGLDGHVLDARYIAWGAEEFTRMGYSSLPPGGLGLRATLAAPIGALHFAGEATNPAHPATVHGAIESGRRAAAELPTPRSP
jgi:monoamine oxidase